MPRTKNYRVEVLRIETWFPSSNFSHRVSGPYFKSRVAAQHGLKKYRSKNPLKYRIVAVQKVKAQSK